MKVPLYLILVSSLLASSVSHYIWPSPQFDAIEMFLYEGTNVFGDQVSGLTDQCQKRGGPPTRQSSTVAAEWLRLAYHDMATHNMTDGTGGLDASIFYELDRAENIGSGNANSIIDFTAQASKYVSRSDVIAMGAVWAVASCGGPQIAYRYGRKDSLQAGRLGVPEPQQDLASHTESFRLQGFTQTEMISLVACGHTLGGVRSIDFPEIVIDSTNASIATFDTTVAYDNRVVSEYLDSSTMNPLVRAANATLASDKRIFSSDGNVTMKSLKSENAYSRICGNLLAKMIDTVPSNVQLSEEITILPAKVSDAQITVIDSQLVFMATLRLTHQNGTSIPSNRQVKMFWCDRRGQFGDCNGLTNVASSPVTGVANTSPLTASLNLILPTYDFKVPILANRSVSKFWFEVDEEDVSRAIIYNNGGSGYPILQDEIINVPWLGSTQNNFENDTVVSTENIVAGVRSEVNPSSTFIHILDYSGNQQIPVLNTTIPLVKDTSKVLVDGYSYYEATLVESNNLFPTMDLEAVIDAISYTVDYRTIKDLGKSPSLLKVMSAVTNITTSRVTP